MCDDVTLCMKMDVQTTQMVQVSRVTPLSLSLSLVLSVRLSLSLSLLVSRLTPLAFRVPWGGPNAGGGQICSHTLPRSKAAKPQTLNPQL
jgi:hypothetical protein